MSSSHRPNERHFIDDAGAAPVISKRSITRPNKNTSSSMPFLTASASGPTTIGKRALPLQDSSFRSAVSYLSLSSANATNESNSWLCTSCSYRNSDVHHTNCALCGHELASRVQDKNRNQTKAAIGSDQFPVLTIDSSISLFSNGRTLQSSDPCLSVNSLTACSRTTRTSNSTKVTSNCWSRNSKTCRPKDSLSDRRPSYEDAEEDGCTQPPSVTYCQASPPLNFAFPQKEEDGSGGDDDVNDENDSASIASAETERCSNHSSLADLAVFCDSESGTSENISCGGSLNSHLSHRKVPYDDPIEQPSSTNTRGRVRRAKGPLLSSTVPTSGHEIPSMVVVATTTGPHPQPCGMEADDDTSVACSRSSRTKECIKNYIPGLLRRRKQRSRTDDFSGAPPTPPSHNSERLEEKGPTSHPLDPLSNSVLPPGHQHDTNGGLSPHRRPPQPSSCRDNQDLQLPAMVARFEI